MKMRKPRIGYDLPLHKKAGTGFTLWVIALMTFLCAITLSGSFVLNSIAHEWEKGIEGQMTIEIKAQSKGKQNNISTLKEKVLLTVKNEKAIASYQEIRQSELEEMIGPWLGVILENKSLMEDFPLPTLIALQIKPDVTFNSSAFQTKLKTISEDISLDTHEEWLSDMVALTNKIRNISFVLALMIGATALSAVIGASRSRLSMHFSDIKLLHLIGASDDYIAKQFSKHATILTLQGCLIGTILTCLALWGIFSLQGIPSNLLPHLELTTVQWVTLGSIPFIAAMISYYTAGVTTHRFLRRLP